MACLGSDARVLLGGGARRPRGGQARQRVQRRIQSVRRDGGVDREVEELARGQRRDARAPEECVHVRRVLPARVRSLILAGAAKGPQNNRASGHIQGLMGLPLGNVKDRTQTEQQAVFTRPASAAHLAQEVERARVVQVHRLAYIDEPQLPLRGKRCTSAPRPRRMYRASTPARSASGAPVPGAISVLRAGCGWTGGDRRRAARRAHGVRGRPARAPARALPATRCPQTLANRARRTTTHAGVRRMLATARASRCINALS